MASLPCTWQRLPHGTRWSVLLAAISFSGCAMCQSDFDHYYGAYGGRRARADMVHGRVGSILDPAPEVAEPAGPPMVPMQRTDGPAPALEPIPAPESSATEDAPLFDPSDRFWGEDLPAGPAGPELELP